MKKLQTLTQKESPEEKKQAKTTNTAAPEISSMAPSGMSALRNLVETGNDSLLTSEKPANRIQGLVGIKKYLAKQLGTKEITADRAHELLEELSMLMRTILNDTNTEVYLEGLKLLQYAFKQLLKSLTSLDLQITVSTLLSILLPKAIQASSHKIQIATEKFIVQLGHDSLIGPAIILKCAFRLVDKLASECTAYIKSLRMSSSQHGFSKDSAPSFNFDASQNVSLITKYMGVVGVLLSRFKSALARNKDAIECFATTACNLWEIYTDRPQVRDAVILIAHNIQLSDPQSFDFLLSKKGGEGRTRLGEILAATPSEQEPPLLGRNIPDASHRKWQATQGSAADTKDSIQLDSKLPSVYPPIPASKLPEEQKASKQLPSYAKRLGKNTESSSNIVQGLPPIGGVDRRVSLPPLVIRKSVDTTKKDSPTVPIWLAQEENANEKQMFGTKGNFGHHDTPDDNDDPIRAKASMSQPLRFPK
jgi:hypothetical protein